MDLMKDEYTKADVIVALAVWGIAILGLIVVLVAVAV